MYRSRSKELEEKPEVEIGEKEKENGAEVAELVGVKKEEVERSRSRSREERRRGGGSVKRDEEEEEEIRRKEESIQAKRNYR